MPRNPWATRGLQWYEQWAVTPKGETNPEIIPQWGLSAVTRRHERGIPSNRVSSSHGEYVSAPCTHRPSLHPSVNKVAVGEPAAGSPPYKIFFKESYYNFPTFYNLNFN